jgi:transcription elongation factor GreA
MSQEKALSKLESLFKEEQWGRIEPKDVGTSKFKILDDLFNLLVSEGMINEAVEYCREHLEKRDDSITAAYLLGLAGYHRGNIEDSIELRKLIDVFIANQKWAVVEILSEKVLEYGEDSAILRALAASLERLGRSKEAVPGLENLLKINRFDTEVAKKLAMALVDKFPEKSVYYMKLAIEGFIKKKEYESIPSIWGKFVQLAWQDSTFFERVERMLVDGKQQELAASLLKTLLNKYREAENLDVSIELLKKILLYKSDDAQMRRDLVKLYKDKYGSHSQFEQFIKLSKLNNFKTHIKFAIQDFENYIIFDVDNYAFHNSWKTGKIKSIDSEFVVVDFKNKEEHQMSIKMALQSLAPIQSDHLYALEYEDPDGLKKIFAEDFIGFFEILIKSYGGKIHLSDIKHELIHKYIEEKSWAKWWNRARTQIKKSPLFGVSEKKKDIIFMREKPVTYVDELLDKFSKTGSFSAKLDIAVEFSNNIDNREGSPVAQFFTDYFVDETKGTSNTRLILSYLILKDLVRLFGQSKVNLDSIREKVIGFIKTADELPLISMKINSYDYKKDFVNLIEESRDDWPRILPELLFETPVRIHRYIFNTLLRTHAYNEINNFIDRAITGARQFPEIFLWAAKNIFNRLWDYDWLDYSKENLNVNFFRLMNDL